MARKISIETHQDLLPAVRERYGASLEEEKLRILDEFVSVNRLSTQAHLPTVHCETGDQRVLSAARLPGYDEAVREALILLWDASDRVCGKRLEPLLPLRRGFKEFPERIVGRHLAHERANRAVRARATDASVRRTPRPAAA